MEESQAVQNLAYAEPGERSTYVVLGVNVDIGDHKSVTEQVERWIKIRQKSRYITFSNVHAVITAKHDMNFHKVLDEAALVCPDGMPLVWVGHAQGRQVSRIYGPDFMLKFLKLTHHKGYTHYFYGGSPEVVKLLSDKLKDAYPGLQVAGIYSPPYRALTIIEERSIADIINKADPDVLWVGLGCPKQEIWMNKFSKLLRVPVMLGVGQAFDIHAGTLQRAPLWMHNSGLEWLFRLLIEPGRLWRRYLVTNTEFVLYIVAALITGRLKHQQQK